MSDFVLYNYFRSSTSYRVRIALNFKAIQYKYEPVHLVNNGGEQHSPQYRKLNPSGEVPTLVHKGHSIGQTMAIFDYLESVKPSPSLFPKDALARAKVIQICEAVNCGLHPMSNLKVTQFLTGQFNLSDGQKDQWIQHWMKVGLTALDSIVASTKGKFAFGDQVSAADMFIIPHLFSARRFNVNIDSYQNLLSIEKSCIDLDFFDKAHPLKQPDTPKS
jgi:maleylacetoacetate isomerase